MADFVAVIRRAVDGLATNTPETRAKVYEKARGAVQRQLENMKPRPPEEMLRRQMDKLQAAIDEVETEHQEALAPEEVFAAPVPEPAAYPEPPLAAAPAEEDVQSQPSHAEPSYTEPHAVERDSREPEEPVAAVYHDPAVVAETAAPAAPDHQPEPHYEPAAPEPVHYEEDRYSAQAPEQEPEATDYREASWHDEAVAPHPAPVEPADELVPDHAASRMEDEFVHGAGEPAAVAEHDHFHEPVHGADVVEAMPENGMEWHAEPAPVAAEPAAASWTWHEPEETQVQAAPAEVAAAWDDVPELTAAGPVETIVRGPSAEHVEAHFDQETHVTADAVRMPPVSELPDLAAVSSPVAPVVPATEPSALAPAPAFDDPFADYLAEPRQDKEAAQAKGIKDAERDPWGDLEDLIGYNDSNVPPDTAAGKRSLAEEDELADLMPPPSKPYRVTPVRKRNYGGMLLALVGLLVIAGGGYALWMNRDSLSSMVDGLMQSNVASNVSSNQSQPAQNPASTTPAPATSSAQTQSPAPASNNTAASAAPATTDAGAATGKFTQRLMPDGKEVDEGPGTTGGLAQNAEGQSVAQLNAPPANPGPGAPASGNNAGDAATAPAAGAAPATPSAPAPNATPSDTPVVAGEKMFLYEERIGQTAPTAIDGTVAWSLQREPGANGAPPEPVVQGRITIPGRGLTALMTFKRNSDPSLPASHLIEIVFAVPPDFEGGAIDSVQRIAMKQTEQDRGNALIAVPAKITDDFHMIALNDFPDARNTNLELLRTRNWIDIPLAYRNGRRALLTLQKGPEGERAFNEAIREWGQMGNAPTGQ